MPTGRQRELDFTQKSDGFGLLFEDEVDNEVDKVCARL